MHNITIYTKIENNSREDELVSLLANFTSDADYFEDVYLYASLTPTTILVFVIGLIIGTLGPVSLIWYERNCDNRFRTILNQMFVQTGWFLLAYVWLIYIPEGARILLGPYGEIFCDMHNFLRNILFVEILLTLDAILVLRYIFIFSFKNFAIINDDLLARFFSLSILLVALWTSLVKRVTPGNLPLNYYLCTGLNPSGKDGKEGSFLDTPQKYNTGRIVMITSFLLHLVTVPRIVYYQLVTVRTERPLRLGIIDNERMNNVEDVERSTCKAPRTTKTLNSSQTLLDILTQITFLLCLVAVAVAIRYGEEVEPKSYNMEKYRNIALMVQIYLPCVGFTALHTVLFARNAAMRQRIWKKIKVIFKRNQVGIEE